MLEDFSLSLPQQDAIALYKRQGASQRPGSEAYLVSCVKALSYEWSYRV